MARIEDEVGMDPTVNLRLGVALALGLIIGIERGWERRGASEGMRTAGVRTFGFAGLSGAVAALLADELGQAVLAAALLGFAALVTASYLATARPSEDYGFTTELVLLLTFGLGAMAMSGHEIEAVAAAVVTALVLGFKRELHRSLERLEEREVRATLQLLAIALVVLPLVPNQGMGPWQALNPRTIGLLVLLIASISYVGYFAIRLLGARRGLLLTAFFGGLSSSTAVTVAFARMAEQRSAAPALLGAGIGIAAATMAPRLLLEVAVVERSLVASIWIPLAVLAAVPLAAAAAIASRAPSPEPAAEVAIRNPLDLEAALLYGAILAALFLAVRAVQEWFGATGVYALAALSGLADVDAIAISLAEGTREGAVDPALASRAIVLAALVNTAVKAGLAVAIGGRQLLRWCGAVLAAAVALSGLVAWVTIA
jgi:uncharacterized membrane protein (DUF4010 family)